MEEQSGATMKSLSVCIHLTISWRWDLGGVDSLARSSGVWLSCLLLAGRNSKRERTSSSDTADKGGGKRQQPGPIVEEEAKSLHTLLEPFCRRTATSAGACKGSAAQACSPASQGAALFDAALVLLARGGPAVAEELQARGRMDEECAVVENMQRSPLIVAARCGLVAVAWLIARHCSPGGAALNQQDSMGCSALRYAIVSKDERMCRCLLGFEGLNLEQPDARGDTALLQAVGANAPAVCRMLLDQGADATFANRGQTALDLAEALGYEECASILRERGAPSGSDGRGQRTEDAAWSDGDDDLAVSEEERDVEMLMALRESRRMAAEAAAKAAGVLPRPSQEGEARRKRSRIPSCAQLRGEEPWTNSEDEELSKERQRPPKRRWDSGGLFIKRRGCQAQAWHGP
eukprot:TRINITY_DN41065_c0_g1_i1.p1 TRINITY_DN41065_c0_g1~~TRINITY_DN41065_c0_g1_i1.p1  ORF type:complete len:405 (-),score=75.20 TRINITY_DN41065_c0_g1_i1:6-1220(-)